MAEKTFWETLKAEGDAVIDAIRDLIHKGNVRRVVCLLYTSPSPRD